MLDWRLSIVKTLFLNAYIDLNGTWKSPRDERKSYSNGDMKIMWWSKEKSFAFWEKKIAELSSSLAMF